jgi:hypothetical protein
LFPYIQPPHSSSSISAHAPGLLPADAQREARKRARAGAAAANRAKRESRQVPALIFQIEEFERHLILLSTQGALQLRRPAPVIEPVLLCFLSSFFYSCSILVERCRPCLRCLPALHAGG